MSSWRQCPVLLVSRLGGNRCDPVTLRAPFLTPCRWCPDALSTWWSAPASPCGQGTPRGGGGRASGPAQAMVPAVSHSYSQPPSEVPLGDAPLVGGCHTARRVAPPQCRVCSRRVLPTVISECRAAFLECLAAQCLRLRSLLQQHRARAQHCRYAPASRLAPSPGGTVWPGLPCHSPADPRAGGVAQRGPGHLCPRCVQRAWEHCLCGAVVKGTWS